MKGVRGAGIVAFLCLGAGCGALVGEDFGGYRNARCLESSMADCGGGADALGGADGQALGGGGKGGSSAAGASGGGSACCSDSGDLRTCCDGHCTDTKNDPKNCGACGNACSHGRVCTAQGCAGGWLPMTQPPASFVARSSAASVAMGASVFFWGGRGASGHVLDNGAIYSPMTDSWTFLPHDDRAPSARALASAVWTGTVVVVFGGSSGLPVNPLMGETLYADGAIYDPASNSWSSLPKSSAITPRVAQDSFWDGSRAIFWGGYSSGSMAGQRVLLASADSFDLVNWSVSSSAGAPGPLFAPAVAVGGVDLYLMGGSVDGSYSSNVYSYALDTDTWATLPESGLTARSNAFGIGDSSHFVVWGGRDDNGLRNDGKYLSGKTWTDVETAGAPGARMLVSGATGWSFEPHPNSVAIVGGQSSSGAASLATNGGVYDLVAAHWIPIPGWLSGEAHQYGMGAWTGSEFVVWGGFDREAAVGGVTSTGERWAP